MKFHSNIGKGANMSKRKSIFHFTLSFLIMIFIILPIMQWLGIPSFAVVLEFLFGEPKGTSIIYSILFSGLVVFLIMLVLKRAVRSN